MVNDGLVCEGLLSKARRNGDKDGKSATKSLEPTKQDANNKEDLTY